MTPDELKAELQELAEMSATAAGAEKTLKAEGGKRLEAMDKELAELRPRALIDDAAAERYKDLTEDRARLMKMLAS